MISISWKKKRIIDGNVIIPSFNNSSKDANYQFHKY